MLELQQTSQRTQGDWVSPGWRQGPGSTLAVLFALCCVCLRSWAAAWLERRNAILIIWRRAVSYWTSGSRLAGKSCPHGTSSRSRQPAPLVSSQAVFRSELAFSSPSKLAAVSRRERWTAACCTSFESDVNADPRHRHPPGQITGPGPMMSRRALETAMCSTREGASRGQLLPASPDVTVRAAEASRKSSSIQRRGNLRAAISDGPWFNLTAVRTARA